MSRIKLPALRLQVVLLFAAAVLPFVAALGNGFAFDDKGLILDNPVVWETTPFAAWTTRYWPEMEAAGLYRPLSIFSYWLDARLWGARPLGFILTNLWLHAAITLLAHSVLRRLFPTRHVLAFVTALVFAIHPIHSEVVVGIVGRSELLAALFGLAAYRLALESRRSFLYLFVSGLCFGFSLLAKESATTLWLLPVLHYVFRFFDRNETESTLRPESEYRSNETDGARDDSPNWIGVGVVWSIALLFSLLARIRVLGTLFGLGTVGVIDNPLYHASAWERVSTALGIQLYAISQYLLPTRIAVDYSFPQIVPSSNWTLLGGLYLVLILGLFFFALRNRDRKILWGWAFAFIASLLTTNVFIAIGTVYGERLTYLPSLGWIWILGCLAVSLPLRTTTRRIGVVVAVLWMLALGVRSELRADDWKNNLVLFEATVQASPRSAKAWTNLAAALGLEERWEEAHVAGERAVELYPTYPAAMNILATALNKTGDPQGALQLLNPVVGTSRGRMGDALLEIGHAYILLENGAAAESTFIVASREPTLPERDRYRWQVGLASAYALQSNWPKARTAWSEVAEENPDHLPIQQRFAYALWQNGEPDSAEVVYRRVLEGDEENPDVLNAVAWFLASERRSLDEAVQLAERAFKLRSDPNIADTWFEAVFQSQGCAGARDWLDRVSRGARDWYPLEEKWKQRCDPESGTPGNSTGN